MRLVTFFLEMNYFKSTREFHVLGVLTACVDWENDIEFATSSPFLVI